MWTTTLALVLLGAPAGQEQTGASTATTDDDLRNAFVDLEDEYDEAKQEWYGLLSAAYQKAQESNGESAFTEPDPIEPDWYPRFADLAVEGSIDAEVWCIVQHRYSGLDGDEAHADTRERYELVLSEARPDAMLQSVTYALMSDARASYAGKAYTPSPREAEAFAFLDAIDALTKSDDLRALTLYARGSALIPYMTPDDKKARGLAYYEKAANAYPKTEMGQRCAGYVFAGKNLKVGMKAPDIVGKDHDGNDLKLSDFAGKVAVIDFWGFW